MKNYLKIIQILEKKELVRTLQSEVRELEAKTDYSRREIVNVFEIVFGATVSESFFNYFGDVPVLVIKVRNTELGRFEESRKDVKVFQIATCGKDSEYSYIQIKLTPENV